MNRTDWEFEYTASNVAKAAAIKKETHQKKLDWWTAKKNEVMDRVKATGISIQDSVAASYSNTKGFFGPQIQIDEGMQRDLTECQQKILEHTQLVQAYAAWMEILQANPGNRLKLDHEDWLFFFGT